MQPSADQAADRSASIADALQTAHLPVASAGLMARDSVWRVFIDDGRTPRVYLIHAVVSLVLPDGPIELTEPVTAFRYDGTHWRVAPVRGVDSLPTVVATALSSDFTDTTRAYFYLVRAVDAGMLRDASPTGASSLASVALGMARDVERYRRMGFIGADAEP